MIRDSANSNAPAQRRSAYSLIELVLALALIALLVLGAQSAILMSSKALPNKDSPESRRLATVQALDLMAADLADAVTVSRATPLEIELTVPDRDGDGQPETIRYSRTGMTSGPLRRTFNAQVQTLMQVVQSFTITYATRDVAETQTLSDGPEVLLASNDTGLSSAAAPVEENNWIATTFRPALPADAAAWTLTRVKIRTRSSGAPLGRSLVQVRPAVAGVPTGAVLDEVSSPESLLPAAFAWQDVAFVNAPRFAPGESAAVVVRWAGDAQSCDVEFQGAGAAVGNAGLAMTADGGGSWVADSAKAMFFYAYGRVTSPASPTYGKRLVWIRAGIEYDVGARLERAVRVSNEPTVVLQ